MSTLEHLSVVDGTESVPAVNFGVGGAADTGMYLPLTDAVGFSTGGVNKVGILKADSAPYINGLNVGTTAVIAGIQRLSGTAANSWEDGNMGNSAELVFTPADFICANPTNGAAVGAITTSFVNMCNNANGWSQTLGSRFGTPSLCHGNSR